MESLCSDDRESAESPTNRAAYTMIIRLFDLLFRSLSRFLAARTYHRYERIVFQDFRTKSLIERNKVHPPRIVEDACGMKLQRIMFLLPVCLTVISFIAPFF